VGVAIAIFGATVRIGQPSRLSIVVRTDRTASPLVLGMKMRTEKIFHKPKRGANVRRQTTGVPNASPRRESVEGNDQHQEIWSFGLDSFLPNTSFFIHYQYLLTGSLCTPFTTPLANFV
jgi:hypothetical protein